MSLTDITYIIYLNYKVTARVVSSDIIEISFFIGIFELSLGCVFVVTFFSRTYIVAVCSCLLKCFF